jgi:ABC-type Fe3+-siderophore transport system permease subunit
MRQRMFKKGASTMTLIFHLIKSLFRAFFKITFTALFVGVLAAGATLLVAYLNDGHVWPPRTLIEVAAAAIGVLAAYAAGLTMLLREALHAALTVEHGVAKEVEQEVAGVDHELAGSRR